MSKWNFFNFDFKLFDQKYCRYISIVDLKISTKCSISSHDDVIEKKNEKNCFLQFNFFRNAIAEEKKKLQIG